MADNATVLTGSVATGKSTVAGMLKEAGYNVIDADRISREVFKIKEDEIARFFDTTNRQQIAAIIFTDPRKKKKLEEIMHPTINSIIIEEAKKLELLNKRYFIEIPLFFENYGSYPFKKSVVVYAPRELQFKRLTKKRGLGADMANAMINAQISIEEKKKRSAWIDNSGDIDRLQKNVEHFIRNA
ncbi:MAG: dephospho-CoA kinase [Helicobacteraceae bacterium]|nr:dephospho-CoA kinase [Helicobacteraceae bacterium]